MAVIFGVALLGAAVGVLVPRVVYRFSVPVGQAPVNSCRYCLEPLRRGIRGWAGLGACPACRRWLTSWPWLYVVSSGSVAGLLLTLLPHHNAADVLLVVAWLVFAIAGMSLAAIDFRVQRLPAGVVTGAALVAGALVLAAALAGHRIVLLRDAGVGAAVLGVAYLAVAVLLPGQLGIGDVRLAVLCGMLLGTRGWEAMAVGAALPWVMAALVAGALVIAKRIPRGGMIPFGPYMVAGTLIAAVTG